MPITINKLGVSQGTFRYLDRTISPQIDLHVDSMQMTVLNMANVERQNDILPSILRLRGTSIGPGQLELNMQVNLLKEIPDLKMDLKLTGVNITNLDGFIEAYGKFDVERGNLDLYSELKLTDGLIEGYAKPFVTNLKVLDWKKEKKEGGILHIN